MTYEGVVGSASTDALRPSSHPLTPNLNLSCSVVPTLDKVDLYKYFGTRTYYMVVCTKLMWRRRSFVSRLLILSKSVPSSMSQNKVQML